MFRRNGSELARIRPLAAPPNFNGTVQTGIERNYQSDELRPLYFLHTAKTGGTSLTAALKGFYDAGEVISDEGNYLPTYQGPCASPYLAGCGKSRLCG
jgi:hypothetical protein